MYRNAVRYIFKNEPIWLAPNSEAYRLYSEKKIKELDILLEQCNNKYVKLSK